MGKFKLITGLIGAAAFFLCTNSAAVNIKQKATHTVESPDKSISLIIDVKDRITYSVSRKAKFIIGPSAISMTLADDLRLGEDPVVTDARLKSINQRISSVVPEKFAVIDDNCNELTLEFEGSYSVIFRVYDNGVAYCFKTSLKKDIKVISEKAEFNFTGNNVVYFPEEKSFFSHNEPSYLRENLETMAAGRLASLPLLVSSSGVKILLTESALRDYPGPLSGWQQVPWITLRVQ
jgi:alpha-glucosidase